MNGREFIEKYAAASPQPSRPEFHALSRNPLGTLNGERPFMGNSRMRGVEVHAALGVGREGTRPGGGILRGVA